MHICVIGAGVIGVTTAYALARAGHGVTLLDTQPSPGCMTSRANGGQLSYSYVAPLAEPGVIASLPRWLLRSNSPLRFRPRCSLQQWRWLATFLAACNRSVAEETTRQLLALSYLSRDTLHAWQRERAIDFDFRSTGKLIVYRSQEALEKAAALVDFQARFGAKQRVLSAAELLQREPSLAALRGDVAGAIFTEDEETGDCQKFTSALAEELKKMPDFTYRMNASVTHLRREGSRVVAACISGGEEVTADAFVVAAGLGSAELLRPLGQDAPLCGLKGYSLTVPLNGRHADVPEASVTDYERHIVYARLGDTLRAAAMVDIGDNDASPNPRRVAQVRAQVRALFPGLAVDTAEPWAGLRSATPTGKPLVGASVAADNLWLNIGHGALGFTLACGTAVLLNALIDGAPTPIAAAAFQP